MRKEAIKRGIGGKKAVIWQTDGITEADGKLRGLSAEAAFFGK